MGRRDVLVSTSMQTDPRFERTTFAICNYIFPGVNEVEALPHFSPSPSTKVNNKYNYNALVLPTFLYGSENWTSTASQRRRIEAAEMKLPRPLAGYTFYDYKTNKSIRRELQTDCILDKIDEYRRNWLVHIQRMPQTESP